MNTPPEMHLLHAADQAARAGALDVARSFIVQAPAGSGKTELLIQRYLRLLATVDQPEDVVAMTFTRKAAGEMRERVLAALDSAVLPAPELPHKRITWTLARDLAAHSSACAWDLRLHPARLSIQTIDAWCAKLTRAAPLSAGLGLVSQVTENAGALYAEAARRYVLGQPMPEACARLLRHLDNRVDRLVDLVAGMLAHRDQWLPWLIYAKNQSGLREELERNWAQVLEDAMRVADAAFPAALKPQVIDLIEYARGNFGTDPALQVWAGSLAKWPDPTHDMAAWWRATAGWLLTKSGTIRKAVNSWNGFPGMSGATGDERQRRRHYKAAMEELLEALQAADGCRDAWDHLRRMPPATYAEAQWETVAALLAALPVAVAELKVVFAQNNQTDFVEVALGALEVLGDETAPTDLLLAYDQRIQHVLVDEFQDTSLAQFGLIARLTAGWSPGDGRTLFVVGDPMQSIYRFRGAEVALFLDAQRDGFPGVALEPLRLRVNFRSEAPLVEWVNRVFATVLPAVDRPEEGAASFVSATAATGETTAQAGVQLHGVSDTGAQAAAVVALVQSVRAVEAGRPIAILVRARSHLRQIVPALRTAGIEWQAVDIDPLVAKQSIIDCLALTHALLEPADRLNWLAVLRAPWCGLTLADLTALTDGLGDQPLPGRLLDADAWTSLSDDGKARLRRCAPILGDAADRAGRGPLARTVETAWLRLGGAAALKDREDFADVERYWRLLTEHSRDAGFDRDEFDAAVDKLYGESITTSACAARPDPALQIMTLHRAKGLEFDTVIIPGLAQGPGRSDPPLLHWRAGRTRAGGRRLLLAPIKEEGLPADAQYDYLSRRSVAEERHELARLLYVGATRAKRSLHLLAVVPPADQPARPRDGSALGVLWPALETEWPRPQHASDPAMASRRVRPPQCLRRLVATWQPPAFPDRPATAPQTAPETLLAFDWAQDTARAVGIVAHEVLERIGRDGLSGWDLKRLDVLARQWRVSLAEEGVPPPELDAALARLRGAIAGCLQSPRGRWLFDPAHADAHSEHALTAIEDGAVARIVVDRTFIDGDGVRWIVDFKTSQHGGADLERFLDREVDRYRSQLERYARIWSRLDNRPIRLGLYFPLHDAWRAWESGEVTSDLLA